MNTLSKNISFFNTYIDPSAEESVTNVLRSTFLSEGKLVKEFETKLTEVIGMQNPIALNSGTSSLHLALVIAGVGPGDEVVLPAQTFVATATTIVQQGAVPVFADIDYVTGNISPASIEEKITKKTKAVVIVDWAGLPADLEEIAAIAHKHNLMVIEDAAHALGATYKHKPIGAISDLTCFSFQAIKHVTTGDGGAIAGVHENLAEEARVRRWFGIDRAHATPNELGERDYDITKVGFKYHLSDYGAALGLANLKSFPERLIQRRAIAALYRQKLAEVPGLTLFDAPIDRESAYWLFGFHVQKRGDFIRMMKEADIPTSVVHRGIDHNSLFGGTRQDLVNQRHFDETQINIPLHDAISEEDACYIIETIKKGW